MSKFRFIPVLLAVALIVSGFPVISASAAVSDKTAAEWAKELGVPEESIIFPSGGIYKKDYSRMRTAQDACNQITFLPGATYYLESHIDPGDGLKVLANGATIIMRSSTSGCIFDRDNKKPGYTNTVGVTIEGGNWIIYANKKPKKPVSAIKFVHAADITIKNMRVISDYATHMVELIGVKNALIEGCTFEMAKKHYFPGNEEVIQLDVANGGRNALNVYADNTTCSDITIKNNKIKFFRGIGNVVPSKKYRYANITVTGNTITTTKGYGLYLNNVQNVTAENNTFYSSSSSSVISTKMITGTCQSPRTMSKLTVSGLKRGMTKIKGKKDKAGIVTVTIGGVRYTYGKWGTAYAIKVPALKKGAVVAFEQRCGYGNIFRFSQKVK